MHVAQMLVRLQELFFSIANLVCFFFINSSVGILHHTHTLALVKSSPKNLQWLWGTLPLLIWTSFSLFCDSVILWLLQKQLAHMRKRWEDNVRFLSLSGEYRTPEITAEKTLVDVPEKTEVLLCCLVSKQYVRTTNKQGKFGTSWRDGAVRRPESEETAQNSSRGY